MPPEGEAYFLRCLRTPSPSGYEEAIQAVTREHLDEAADGIRIDIHGNLIADAGPDDSPRLMYAGHCDQIGMIVSHIDETGFVRAQTIGGWDPQQLIGQAMSIWTGDGEVPAVISRKPIHLLSQKERGQVVQLEDMWLDIGAADREDAAAAVRVGDPITLALNVRKLRHDRWSGPGMDNKSGLWVVAEAFRRSATTGTLRCHLHTVATVQEEVGLRGAKTAAGSVNPDVAIAVDVTHASDCPTIDKNQRGDIRIGGGPVIYRGPNINRRVADRLERIAAENDLPHQIAAIGRATPNDANVLQVHGRGVAVGLVAVPNRYMHSAVEVIGGDDLEHAAELLKHFALSLTPECDFTPRVEAP